MFEIRYFQSPAAAMRDFVGGSPQGSVTQSILWGQLQAGVPSRGQFWAFAVFEKKQIVGSCVLIRHRLGRKRCYLYAHRGPVCDPRRTDVWERILAECDKLAREQNAIFLRVDPAWWFTDFGENPAAALPKFQKFFQKSGFQPAHAQYQPLSTLQLDLTKTPEELRAEMRSMGKRNLKKALKSELEIGFVTNPLAPELEEFDKLNRITTERDGFWAHEIGYYRRILQTLGPADVARLYFAKFRGEPLAMALTTFFGKEAVYYYGASSNAHRELLAPWALQWQMITDAQSRGCTRYDFLGIAPQPLALENGKWGVWLGTHLQNFADEKSAQNFCDRRHAFSKITFFKTRWGGTRRDFVGAWEKIYHPHQFRPLIFVKKIRRGLRRLGLKI